MAICAEHRVSGFDGAEVPHVGVTQRIGMGVARMNGVYHALGQVPCAGLATALGDHQFDHGAVADVVTIAAHDQR